MKQIVKYIALASVASLLFISCNKEIEVQITEEPIINTYTVDFATAPMTKTVFGTPSGSTLPTLWTATKTVGISLNFESLKQSTNPVVANEGATASFSADISASGSSPYVFYAISPYSSVQSISSSYNSALIEFPSSQTPLDASVDEGAQILIAKNNAGDVFPTSSVTLAFEHLSAYGKLSFANLSLAGGESIASVALTSPTNWAGRYYYYFEDNDSGDKAGDLKESSASKTITLTTTKTTDIWFACAPVDLGGQNLKIVITTNVGTTYTKNVTIPAGKTFASGKVNSFTVNMSGIDADSSVDYVLVTNAADLTVGSEVIIAATGDYDFALSTTQNPNNRAATAQAKSSDDQTISSPGDAVQILTIAAGNTPSTIAFSTGSGYLCAASSGSNYLRTQETLDDEGSWTVSIDEGVATIIAQGLNTRNYMRYNISSNIFACYATGSSTGTTVSIYKKVDPDAPAVNLLKTSINGVAAGGVSGVSESGVYSVSNATDENITVTCDGSIVTAAAKNNGAITYSVAANTGAARSGWIKVQLNSETPKQVTVNQLGATHQITLVAPGTGYAIKATVDDVDIATSTTANASANVEVGKTVTISAPTIADGHMFSGWTVSGATVSGNTNPATFTMETADVTITASFTEGGGGGSYTITFDTGSNDGTSASTSTACSTLVSAGSAYLSGNLVTATNVYYCGSAGLKLGTSSNAGVVKMNLASSVTPTSIVVRAKRYNSSKAATISVNEETAKNLTSAFNDYSFDITSSISYLQLNSSKYCWIESITVNY